MEKLANGIMPTNGVVEPDFLEYLVSTFMKWQQLKEEGVELGSREIGKLKNIVEGAKLNARFGFSYNLQREEREADGQEVISLNITSGQGEGATGYLFEAEIYR